MTYGEGLVHGAWIMCVVMFGGLVLAFCSKGYPGEGRAHVVQIAGLVVLAVVSIAAFLGENVALAVSRK